jgi:DNA-directed RNA polymerase subunit beta'
MIKKINFKNKIFRKKELKQVIYEAFINYGIIRSSLLADEIKDLGFNYATKAGISISIEDLKIPPTKKELLLFGNNEIMKSDLFYRQGKINNVERFQKVIDIWNRISETLKSNLITFFENTDPLNSIYLMAFSGARGNLSQIRQLVGMRGLMSDPNGKIIDIPIIHNFREGLTITDYLISSYGARKGVVDTALRTADSGYLTRRLIDVAQAVIIREYNCNTKRSLKIYNKEQNSYFTEKILGRVSAETLYSKKLIISENELITEKVILKIVDSNINSIKVYSPLTCESTRSICQRCYGWDLANCKMIALGEAIGIIAAQSIGEPGTQLTMRTFHTGGIFTSDLSRQIISKLNGLIYYDKSTSIKSNRTLYGSYVNILDRESIFTIIDYENIKTILKLPADSLIFTKNKSFIKKGDLIAELPNKNKQTINSRKDIIATHSGEILFSLEKNIIWVLEGDVYDVPANSFFNKFQIDQKIDFQDNLFYFKLINKKDGIVKIIKDYQYNNVNIIQISNCLKSFINYPIFWDKKKRKLVLLFDLKKRKQSYILQSLPNTIKGNTFFFAQHLTTKYKIRTAGKVLLTNKNNFQYNNIYQNEIVLKNAKILFIPMEIFKVNKDKALLLVANNTKLVRPGTELISNIFSQTNGFVQIKESNQIINEIEIKPGDFFEFTKLSRFQINELKTFDKKIYFPGEIIFEDILIRYLSLVEIIKTKHFYSIILRPIKSFNIPKSENRTKTNQFFINKETTFKRIHTLKFSSNIEEEIKKPINLIETELWYESNTLQSSLFVYKLVKSDKFIENNSFLKKFNLDYYTSLNSNINNKKKLFYRWDEKKIHYFAIMDEEKLNINLLLPKKLNDETLKISVFVKDLEYIEKNNILGKISIIPKNILILNDLKNYFNPNLRTLILGKDNYQTYFKDNYSYFKRKNKFLTIDNKISPLLKIKSSGKIKSITPFKLTLHKGTPFFITSSTTLYIKSGNFIKQDEVLGIISYEQIITGDIVQGLPKIEEILEARKAKIPALLSNNPGIIKKIEKIKYPINLSKISIYANNSVYPSIFKKSLIGIEKKIFVKKNQFIYLGQALTEGSVNPHNLLITYFSFYTNFTNEFEAAYLSFKNIQFLLIEKVQQVYITQGVTISDKHLEVIIKKITSKIQIIGSGDSFLLPNEILELKQINYINEILKQSGKKKILFQPVLLGITKASLLSDSFISAASFQETTKILTAAAIEGKIDWLRGLKENVIIGRLIPAGTGFKK